MGNIFYTLKKNNPLFRHEKFKPHKEHSLGFFVKVNPRMTLRDNFRRRIQDQLMCIDLDATDNQDMIHQDFDSTGNPTGKERVILPTFDLYNREVGDRNGKYHVTSFSYEIRYAPKNAYMLKHLLRKVS